MFSFSLSMMAGSAERVVRVVVFMDDVDLIVVVDFLVVVVDFAFVVVDVVADVEVVLRLVVCSLTRFERVTRG